MPIVRTTIICLALVASGAVRAELKTYDVQPEIRQEIFDILSRMLRSDVDSEEQPELYGRLELLPTGQILVDASPDRQAEIAAVFEAVSRQPVGETPTVALRYWILYGEPGGQDSGNVPDILGNVIRELEAIYGDLGITVIDVAQVVSKAGHPAELENDQWEIEQTVFPNQGRLNAAIDIEHDYQELSVEVPLEQGEFLVLGETTTANNDGSQGVTVIVVHWPDDE